MTSTTLMGPSYGQPGYQWRNDADAQYQAEHSIDPNTGGIVGPLGPVPARSAPLFQAAHEQAVWNARQRRGQSAANYMKGALGLLQSYRPGGGASLESGIYQNLAQVELERANLLQPLDLLGDYRRDQAHAARKAAKKQQTISTAVQIAGIAASFIPGVGPLLGAGITAAGSRMAPQTPGGDGASQTYSAQQGFTNNRTPGGGAQVSGPGQAQTFAPGSQQARAPGGAGAHGTPGQPGAGQPQQAGLERDSGGPGQPGAGPQQPGAGGGAAGGTDGGGAMGAGMPAVGADGRFDPLAYAQQSAMRTVDPVQQVLLSSAIAYQLESDETLQSISTMIDARLRQRGVA